MQARAVKKTFFILLIIILVILSVAFFIAQSNLAKDISSSLEQFKNENISFQHQVESGFLSNKVIIKNLEIQTDYNSIDNSNSQSPISADAVMLSKIVFVGDVNINIPFFENVIHLELPKESLYKMSEGFEAKFISDSKSKGELVHNVTFLDIILDGLGIKSYSNKHALDIFRSLKLEANSGKLYNMSTNQVIGEAEGFLLNVSSEKLNKGYNIDFNMDLKPAILKDGYFSLYRENLENSSDGSDYHQKLIDYLIEYSKYSSEFSMNVDFDLRLDETTKGNKNKLKPKIIDLMLNNILIKDKVGEFFLSGRFYINNEGKQNSKFRAENIVIKLENYKQVVNRYISLMASVVFLENDQNQSTGGKINPIIAAMMPKQEEYFKLIPDITKGISNFLRSIDAVSGKDTNLKIDYTAQGYTVNNKNLMEVLMAANNSFAPVIEKISASRNKNTQSSNNTGAIQPANSSSIKP